MIYQYHTVHFKMSHENEIFKFIYYEYPYHMNTVCDHNGTQLTG